MRRFPGPRSGLGSPSPGTPVAASGGSFSSQRSGMSSVAASPRRAPPPAPLPAGVEARTAAGWSSRQEPAGPLPARALSTGAAIAAGGSAPSLLALQPHVPLEQFAGNWRASRPHWQHTQAAGEESPAGASAHTSPDQPHHSQAAPPSPSSSTPPSLYARISGNHGVHFAAPPVLSVPAGSSRSPSSTSYGLLSPAASMPPPSPGAVEANSRIRASLLSHRNRSFTSRDGPVLGSPAPPSPEPPPWMHGDAGNHSILDASPDQPSAVAAFRCEEDDEDAMPLFGPPRPQMQLGAWHGRGQAFVTAAGAAPSSLDEADEALWVSALTGPPPASGGVAGLAAPPGRRAKSSFSNIRVSETFEGPQPVTPMSPPSQGSPVAAGRLGGGGATAGGVGMSLMASRRAQAGPGDRSSRSAVQSFLGGLDYPPHPPSGATIVSGEDLWPLAGGETGDDSAPRPASSSQHPQQQPHLMSLVAEPWEAPDVGGSPFSRASAPDTQAAGPQPLAPSSPGARTGKSSVVSKLRSVLQRAGPAGYKTTPTTPTQAQAQATAPGSVAASSRVSPERLASQFRLRAFPGRATSSSELGPGALGMPGLVVGTALASPTSRLGSQPQVQMGVGGMPGMPARVRTLGGDKPYGEPLAPSGKLTAQPPAVPPRFTRSSLDSTLVLALMSQPRSPVASTSGSGTGAEVGDSGAEAAAGQHQEGGPGPSPTHAPPALRVQPFARRSTSNNVTFALPPKRESRLEQ
ncbi:hypothetical protein HYH03_006489 [Edaphochlamys debaryana]|uniref:Uncharacterized protein n=1 Tax=Edaphochlamys debaryana TaxID=47281 RepID=A0A835Y7E2_9CHLO|nr:hypothetical protein HYH03_006489 [Edaphochlamys debaryana]|eukprot:KAG2495546.1 hypothetical protein HYH03_006489 [Edaphochlamys debaryana]